jgi:hypothetical protein
MWQANAVVSNTELDDHEVPVKTKFTQKFRNIFRFHSEAYEKGFMTWNHEGFVSIMRASHIIGFVLSILHAILDIDAYVLFESLFFAEFVFAYI